MYGKADAAARKALQESWEKDLTHAQRKETYDKYAQELAALKKQIAAEEKTKAEAAAKANSDKSSLPDPAKATGTVKVAEPGGTPLSTTQK
jgi:hypothetical protein